MKKTNLFFFFPPGSMTENVTPFWLRCTKYFSTLQIIKLRVWFWQLLNPTKVLGSHQSLLFPVQVGTNQPIFSSFTTTFPKVATTPHQTTHCHAAANPAVHQAQDLHGSVVDVAGKKTLPEGKKIRRWPCPTGQIQDRDCAMDCLNARHHHLHF